jgi:hypothetical protein
MSGINWKGLQMHEVICILVGCMFPQPFQDDEKFLEIQLDLLVRDMFNSHQDHKAQRYIHLLIRRNNREPELFYKVSPHWMGHDSLSGWIQDRSGTTLFFTLLKLFIQLIEEAKNELDPSRPAEMFEAILNIHIGSTPKFVKAKVYARPSDDFGVRWLGPVTYQEVR